MTAWDEVPSTRAGPPGRERAWARVIPPLAAAAVLWLIGWRHLALVVAVLGSAIGLAAARWPSVAGVLDRVVTSVSSAVGQVMTAVLLGTVQVLIVAPAALVATVVRRVRRSPALGPTAVGSWRDRPTGAEHVAMPFSAEERPPAGRAGRTLAAVPQIVGAIALLAMLDLAIGSWTRANQPAEASATLAEASAELPWFDEYRDELAAVEYVPEPFVLSDPVDRDGRYIRIEDGLRRTVLPDDVGPDDPEVWIFGGSPAWGEGQRDEHTIASELARLAGAAGTPLRVVNHAQRADSAFVEAQRLERALAAGGRPDLVVFLDGPDDVGIQAERVTGHPSHYGLERAEQEAEDDDRSLTARYRDASALFGVGEALRSFAFAPAWAQEQAVGDASDEEVARAGAEVHARGLALAEIVLDGRLPLRSYWLPTAASTQPESAYRMAERHLDESVVVLPPLDDSAGPVFLDGANPSERGARMMAEAILEDLLADPDALPGG